jgi:MFS family permease
VAEKSVPSAKVTETLAWVIAGLALGGAIPGPLTGHIIDSKGAGSAFIVPFVCLLLANLALLPYVKTWRHISSH